MLTPEQLENTRKFIGGTKAAAILGLSSFQSPLDVYNEIVHQIYDESINDQENVRFGVLLEDVIAKEAASRLCCEIIDPAMTFKHKDYPWLIANPDRLIIGKKEGLEIKNRSVFMSKNYGEEGTDHVLPSENIQCQHYMNILGYEKFHLCVLFGGQKLEIFTIDRNEKLIKEMEKQLNQFWHNNILAQIPPVPRDLKEVNKLFQDASSGTTLEGNYNIAQACDILLSIKKEISALERKKEEAEKEIKMFMQDNEILMLNDNKLATWKNQTRRIFRSDDFKKDHPDLYNQYHHDTKMRVFRVCKEDFK